MAKFVGLNDMKTHALPLTLALTLVACGSQATSAPATVPPSAPSAPQQAEAPLRDAVQRLADAWNAGDGSRWGAEYWPDGSLINLLGVVFPDAQSVGAVTSRILAGPFKGSNFAPTVRRIRLIGNDAAIVDTDVSVTNFRGLPPGAVLTAPGLLLTRLTHVFQNRSGVWKIEASQNTSVLPAPSPTPAL